MAKKATNQPPAAVTLHTYVGNLGCIRFPQAIRKASGIKRGDHLAVTVLTHDAILLKQLNPGDWAQSDVSVDACACQAPPEACWMSDLDVVTVGWSYVQLPTEFATKFGFLSNRPIRLVGESAQITVFCLQDFPDMEEVPLVTCPP